MADIKNFGIRGVGSDVQFGKGGSKLVQTAGTFAAMNALGNAFVRFQVADGQGSNDVISLQQLTNTSVSLTVNTNQVASNLSNTNTGAGLNVDGSYSAPVGSTYLDSATSLAQATVFLDAAVAAEVARASAAESALSNAVGLTNANNVATQSELNQVETSVGLETDGTLTLAAGNYLANAVDLVSAIETLDGVLGNATALAISANATATAAAADAAAANATASAAVANVTILQGQVSADEANIATLQSDVVGLRTDVDSNALAIQGEVSRATGAEAGLDSRLSAVEDNAATYLTLDGSRPMTGTLQMGNNAISGLGTPVNDDDAANKGYVDTAIQSLSGAFEYKGTVAPGADIGNAFVMPVANAGAYYKALNDGYLIGVEANSVAFFAFENDGIVHNTNTDGSETGGTWDVIGHVEYTVSGTISEITVAGSPDTGYTVGIDGAYTASIFSAIDQVSNAIAANVATLQGEIDAANASISTVSNAVTAETARATAAESALSNSVAVVNSAVNAEVVRATAAEGALSNSVAVVNSAVNAEVVRATAAESALSNSVAALAANASTLDATVAQNTSDIANTNTLVQFVQYSAGLQGDGSYAANATGHYVANALSLHDADDLLDTAVFDLSQQLADLSQDTIKTSDSLNSVHVAADAVTTSLNVGGVATTVLTVSGDSANTNTALAINFGTANVVSLVASGTGSDVDLRLAGQGSGHVIIGETGVGYIAADPGYDLTVAGGTGANLNLIGETVVIGEADGTPIAEFTGSAGATSYFAIVNGNSSVTLGTASNSATDIDLVLAPKGAGVINASAAKVTNIADGVADTDAASVGQVNAAIATAINGGVKTLTTTMTAGSNTYTLGTITGTVLDVRVLVASSYDANSQITVGTTITANDLASSSDIDESSPAVYLIETAKTYSNATITATVTNVTGLNGAATVIVEYYPS